MTNAKGEFMFCEWGQFSGANGFGQLECTTRALLLWLLLLITGRTAHR